MLQQQRYCIVIADVVVVAVTQVARELSLEIQVWDAVSYDLSELGQAICAPMTMSYLSDLLYTPNDDMAWISSIDIGCAATGMCSPVDAQP